MFKGIEAKGAAYKGPQKFGVAAEEGIMKDKKKEEIDDMFGASESERSVQNNQAPAPVVSAPNPDNNSN